MRQNQVRKRGISLAVITAVVLLLVGTVGGTLAWMNTQTGTVTNTFTKANPGTDVIENFDKNTKSNVSVKNTGDIESYIRVKLVPTWTSDEAGKEPVGTPASLEDLTITWGTSSKWIQGGDGCWYYTEPVAPGEQTETLIASATVKESENGQKYHMNLQVLSDSVQSSPASAVTDAWGAAQGGSVTAVTDGKLSIGSGNSGGDAL